MKTGATVTRTKVTVDDLRAQVRAFEQEHPGYDRTNYLDLFRDERGELAETADCFKVGRMYRRLARVEAGVAEQPLP